MKANLRGLATSLRLENETDDEAFSRVKESKFLTDIRHQEEAPFYSTEYRFGKLILRVNSAHPFYQKVWQPLAELSSAAPLANKSDEFGADATAAGDAGRRALLGLRLLLLSLARAQVQMTTNGESQAEHAQLFRNLRKSWSEVLETQLLHV